MDRGIEKWFRVAVLAILVLCVVGVVVISKRLVGVVRVPSSGVVEETEMVIDYPMLVFESEEVVDDWGYIQSIEKPINYVETQREFLGSEYDRYVGLIEKISSTYEVTVAMIPEVIPSDEERLRSGITFNLGNYEELGLATIKDTYTAFSVKDGLVVIGYIGDTSVVYAYGLGYLDSVKEIIVVDYSGVELNKGLVDLFKIGESYPLSVLSTERVVCRSIDSFSVLYYKG